MKNKVKRFVRNALGLFGNISTMAALLKAIERSQRIVQQVAMNPILSELRKFAANKQMNYLETLAYIKKQRVSFTRFGDGELRAMLRFDYDLKFQKNSLALRKKLKSSVDWAVKNPKSVLMGFPHPFEDQHWTAVWAHIWDDTFKTFNRFEVLGDAHVSRPCFFEETGSEGVEAWRDLWEGLEVKVITGEGSRFDLTPELFDGVKSATYLFSTPRDAFEDVPRLIDEVRQDKADIYLISLGPAGTVLAVELAKLGKWALDIGHLSDSYLNVFKHEPRPEYKPVVRAPR